jgi:hypothetical protein
MCDIYRLTRYEASRTPNGDPSIAEVESGFREGGQSSQKFVITQRTSISGYGLHRFSYPVNTTIVFKEHCGSL